MLLFIERYPYRLDKEVRDGITVRDILGEVVAVPQKEESHEYRYVGYCYSRVAHDVVFFLPKVVLTGGGQGTEKDTIFGASPEDIIDFDSETLKEKFREEEGKYREYKNFLSELSVWIYRAISVYRRHHNANILESKPINTQSSGRRQKLNTLLDVILSLQDFNRRHRDFFTFIARNMHTGFNKIQWAKTLAGSRAVVQGGTPVYLNPVNRKRVVNFDEELLVIFFSILRYVHEVHGFDFSIDINYRLIPVRLVGEKYIAADYGRRRLRQIKYKYFSDKALRLWDLCYAFFDREYLISLHRQEDDYLLTGDFEHIFEVMIDSLIGGDGAAEPLKVQKDGKLVDHIFIGEGLIERKGIRAEATYYIGDSKYYKRNENREVSLGELAVYKQYTYARNVVQWNMDFFLKEGSSESHPLLRDDLTEGYNPIPNFFISACIPERVQNKKFLDFDDSEIKPHGRLHLNRQFENRLFDRDTLLLSYYDVNFLFIVSLYGRGNRARQAEWREKVRKEFRRTVLETLNRLYDFITLTPRKGKDCHQFIKNNFHRLNGKIYRPERNGNYLVMALMKKDKICDIAHILDVDSGKLEEAVAGDGALKESLQEYFDVRQLERLGDHLSVDNLEQAGTLEELPSREAGEN